MALFFIGIIIFAIKTALMLQSYCRLGMYLNAEHPGKYKEYCGQFFYWESQVTSGKGFAGLQWNFFIYGWNNENSGATHISSFKRRIRVFGMISILVFVISVAVS